MSNVWAADDTFLSQLIFLDDRNLMVSSVDDDEAVQMKAALDNGTPPVQVLSSKTLDIPLLSIVSIKTDKNDDDIEVHYNAGDEVKEKTLSMASKEKRDEVYESLKAAFGDKFSETVDAYSVPRAAFPSLTSLTIFGSLTWGGAWFAGALREAESYEISGSNQGAKHLIAWALELLGPIGVYVIGGLLCALSAFWLYNRVTTPQVMLILQAEPYKRQSTFKLAMKYLGLFAFWWLLFRIAF